MNKYGRLNINLLWNTTELNRIGVCDSLKREVELINVYKENPSMGKDYYFQKFT